MGNNMRNKEKSSYNVPNLERALLIMEYLLDHPDGLGITDVVKGMGFPNNSVFRIMNTLHNHDYLYRDKKSKKFTLSRKLFSMAYGSVIQKNLMECAVEPMRALRDELGETVVISILDKDEGLVLEQVPGLHSFRFVCDPGTKQPLHASASTKCIIANLPALKQKALFKKMEFEKYTENTISDLKTYKGELKKIKKEGYALDNAEAIEGVYCVAAPVFSGNGEPVAALTVTGPANRFKKENLESAGNIVKTYSAEVSRRLGFGLL
jgi:IclR family acetate operon transcriptional repressor